MRGSGRPSIPGAEPLLGHQHTGDYVYRRIILAANLKLVVNNPIRHPRPYTTMYYHSGRDLETAWARVGRASSPLGAVRAAAVQLLRGRYACAIVHGTGGEVQFRLRRTKNRIEILGWFETLTFDKD